MTSLEQLKDILVHEITIVEKLARYEKSSWNKTLRNFYKDLSQITYQIIRRLNEKIAEYEMKEEGEL